MVHLSPMKTKYWTTLGAKMMSLKRKICPLLDHNLQIIILSAQLFEVNHSISKNSLLLENTVFSDCKSLVCTLYSKGTQGVITMSTVKHTASSWLCQLFI